MYIEMQLAELQSDVFVSVEQDFSTSLYVIL